MPSAIKFRISQDGTVNIEVEGVTGTACQDLTRAFEDALGTKTEEHLKPNFFVDKIQTDQEVQIFETE